VDVDGADSADNIDATRIGGERPCSPSIAQTDLRQWRKSGAICTQLWVSEVTATTEFSARAKTPERFGGRLNSFAVCPIAGSILP
jgi:hypothetical protein